MSCTIFFAGVLVCCIWVLGIVPHPMLRESASSLPFVPVAVVFAQWEISENGMIRWSSGHLMFCGINDVPWYEIPQCCHLVVNKNVYTVVLCGHWYHHFFVFRFLCSLSVVATFNAMLNVVIVTVLFRFLLFWLSRCCMCCFEWIKTEYHHLELPVLPVVLRNIPTMLSLYV